MYTSIQHNSLTSSVEFISVTGLKSFHKNNLISVNICTCTGGFAIVGTIHNSLEMYYSDYTTAKSLWDNFSGYTVNVTLHTVIACND